MVNSSETASESEFEANLIYIPSLILPAMEARSIRSFKRADVEDFAARKAEIDLLMTEISADH